MHAQQGCGVMPEGYVKCLEASGNMDFGSTASLSSVAPFGAAVPAVDQTAYMGFSQPVYPLVYPEYGITAMQFVDGILVPVTLVVVPEVKEEPVVVLHDSQTNVAATRICAATHEHQAWCDMSDSEADEWSARDSSSKKRRLRRKAQKARRCSATASTVSSPRSTIVDEDAVVLGSFAEMAKCPQHEDKVLDILKNGSDAILNTVVDDLAPEALDLAFHDQGCRVIQHAVQLLPASYHSAILDRFHGKVVMMALHKNGNHVVQRVIESTRGQSFVVAELQMAAMKVAKHVYGCRVVQRVLEHYSDSQCSQLLEIFSANAQQLMADRYGHFIVEHVLDQGAGQRSRLFDVAVAQAVENLHAISSGFPYVVRVCEKALRCMMHRQPILAQRLFSTVLALEGRATAEQLAPTDHGAALLVELLRTEPSEQRQELFLRLCKVEQQNKQKRVVTQLKRMLAKCAEQNALIG
mmetsp:Transcript_9733/g.23179  ORF Transcript_9733/g.23179 Transcript_9733/m.23179 type:complete len:466 (+) Transcript_9733:56-1453(+)